MKSIDEILNTIRPLIEPYMNSKAQIPDNQIPLSSSTLQWEEAKGVITCLLEHRLTMGEQVLLFEQEFCKKWGFKNALFVNSGSSANLLIVESLRNPLYKKCLFKPGDEILVPALTWSTTITPLLHAGLVPVLIDSDPTTLCLKPSEIEKALSPKTKGIFVAHILGNSVDMDPVMALAKKHNLIVLEDSCEALGTTYNDLPTGRFGLASSFSFFFSHHMTTIEGGMIVTHDDELAEVMRMLRAHGWTRHLKNPGHYQNLYPNIDPRFLFVNSGFNLRGTDIQASIGRAQLQKIDHFNERRIEIAQELKEKLKPLLSHLEMIAPSPRTLHTWFGFPILLRKPNQRKGLVQHLNQMGIDTRPIIAGNLADQPFLHHFPHRVVHPLEGASHVMSCGLYVGSHPGMTTKHIDHLVSGFKSFFKGDKT